MPRRRDGAYYLFHDYDLRAVCDNQQEQMKKAIENASQRTQSSTNSGASPVGRNDFGRSPEVVASVSFIRENP